MNLKLLLDDVLKNILGYFVIKFGVRSGGVHAIECDDYGTVYHHFFFANYSRLSKINCEAMSV